MSLRSLGFRNIPEHVEEVRLGATEEEDNSFL